MGPTRRQFLGVATASAVAGFSGCAGDGDDSTPTDEPAATPTNTPTETAGDGSTETEESTATEAAMAAATVAVSGHPDHGDILVDGEGMVLYMFDSDTQSELASTCTGGCAEAWPPLTTEAEPEAGDAVEAELTTFDRDDGSTQVAANGWPLYHFQNDASPGDANGQGVSDGWWVLDPAGIPQRPEASTPTPEEGEDDAGSGGGSTY